VDRNGFNTPFTPEVVSVALLTFATTALTSEKLWDAVDRCVLRRSSGRHPLIVTDGFPLGP
jgi:hypothetical protein